MYASVGVAHDAQSVSRAREQFLRRIRARRWPSLTERLLYALVAWLPFAALIGYGGLVGPGCDRSPAGCAPSIEVLAAFGIGLTLFVLALLPKLAYLLAMGTFGLLVSAALAVGALILFAAPLPLSIEMIGLASLALLGGYVVGVLIAFASGRPWRAARP